DRVQPSKLGSSNEEYRRQRASVSLRRGSRWLGLRYKTESTFRPMELLRCSGFLFDLDGVLVDSRAVVERTCRRWALRHQLDPEQVLQIAHGRRTRDTVRAIAPHLETDREVAWLDAAELADVDGLSAVPGSGQLLAALPASSWAVVTSCGRALAELRLTAVGLPIPTILVTS